MCLLMLDWDILSDTGMQWIRDVLCKEGDCVNASRLKHNLL